jgi:hypothetical protein
MSAIVCCYARLKNAYTLFLKSLLKSIAKLPDFIYCEHPYYFALSAIVSLSLSFSLKRVGFDWPVCSCKEQPPHAAEVCLDVASTFNVLLSTYSSAYSLPLSNPHLIYLIFTVAMAHLSGYCQLNNVLTTTSLHTQLHLLNCLEVFHVIGQVLEDAGLADGYRGDETWNWR